MADRVTVANPEEEPEAAEAAEPTEVETLGLAVAMEAVPALSAAAAPTEAEAESPCSVAAEAMEPGAAASALEAGPSPDVSVACQAAPEPRTAALGALRTAALGAEPREAGPVLALPALELGPRTVASEGSRSLPGAVAAVALEQADGSPMEAVVETYFEGAPEVGCWPGARSWQQAVEVAELESKRQKKARVDVRSSSEYCPLELDLVRPAAVARLWAHSTCAAPLL